MTTIAEVNGSSTVAELRTAICRAVGVNSVPRTPLTKPTFNSLHAYFTGRFFIKPARLYNPDSPDRPELKQTVAVQVSINSTESEPMAGYFVHVDYVGDRPWNKPELRATVDAMRQSGDQREWTP